MTETSDTERLVPLTAYVSEATRKRVRILAARKDSTMRRIADEAFNVGLDLLEAQQNDVENDPLHTRGE
jgi:hypothetical protein